MLVRVRGTPPDASTSASSATARRKNNAPKAPGNSYLKTWRHFENQEGSRQRWVNAGPCIFSGTGYFTRLFPAGLLLFVPRPAPSREPGYRVYRENPT